MKVSELMTHNPITILPDESIIDKIELFDENEIHHIPVVSAGGDIMGMISSRDVENLTSMMNKISETSRSILARDIMTKPVFSFYEDVDIKQAARAMVENKIHAIVIVNSKDAIVGILTSNDLLKYIADS